MKHVGTYTDIATEGLDQSWDFLGDPYDDQGDEDIWDIDEDEEINDGYPFLAWELIFLTLNEPVGEGAIQVDGQEVTVWPYEEIYEEGTELELKAIPEEGWTFYGWRGNVPEGEEEEQEITIEMDEDRVIIPHFEKDDDTLDRIRDIPGFTSLILLPALVIAVALYRKKMMKYKTSD